MHKRAYRHWLAAAVAFLAVSVVLLWSWNTLAEVFSGPAIQYKHALAAAGMLAALRWALAGGRHPAARSRRFPC